jgi:hypothetical protein
MATIKSYSDLKQSKVLSKILSDKSADMHYNVVGDAVIGDYQSGMSSARSVAKAYKKNPDEFAKNVTPCWSLAALLSVLPLHLIVNNQRYAFSIIKGLDKNGETYAIKYAIFNTTFYFHLTDAYDNPVDACYEMILKLNELKML